MTKLTMTEVIAKASKYVTTGPLDARRAADVGKPPTKQHASGATEPKPRKAG